MFKRSCLTLVLLAGAVAIPSCATDPARNTDPSLTAANARSEPIRLTDVPPPPGMPASALTPFDAMQLESAQLSLAEVVASLTPPAYLQHLGQSSEVSDAQPTLAAQKFYATGKQALLENDNFRAVQQLEKALRLSPNEPAILHGLAEAWTRAGNRVSASNFYRQAFAADPTDLNSLFMLGRFSLDERRWDQAILNLDAALKLAAPPDVNDAPEAHPAAAHFIRFYLANALNQAGHGRAAADLFDAYLTAQPRLADASPYAREISVLSNQRGETLMLLGDLHHRLNEPRVALDAYAAAAEVGVLNPDTLRHRLLYTHLRLGQKRAAQDLLARAVAESQGNAKTLALVPYAVEQGVSAEALSSQLTALYESQGRPASLALAMADVLPADAAVPLLQSHLDGKPGDDAVFGRLLSLLLGDSPSPADHRQAIAATAAAMAQTPDLAEAYANRLLESLDDPATLLPHFPDPATAASLTLRGKVLLDEDQSDAAMAAFEQALELDAGNQLARLELASLQLDRANVNEAEALLGPLAGSSHPRVTLLRVRALAETGQTEEALALIDGVLRRSPPGSPLVLDKADLLLKLGRTEDAERVLLDALNARPTDEAIYAALLAIYNDNGNMIRNYQRLVRRMVDTIPNARITRLVKIETFIAMRQFPQARDLLDTLEDTDDDRAVLQRLRLEVAVGTNQPAAVSSLIDQHLIDAQAAGELPDDEMLTLAIRYFTRQGDRDRALGLEIKRWEPMPPSRERSETLISIYYLQKDYEQAAAIAREAFAQGLVDEQPMQMTSLLVNALAELERFDEAQQFIEQLGHDRPELGGDPAMLLAMVYENRGDTAASRRVMEAALERFPDHAPLNNSLGYGLANEGIRLADAERMVARAVAAEPDTAAYLDSMGWVFYKKAEFDRALNWLERSRAVDGGTHPVIVDHLGDTFYRLGREAEAVRAWNAARAIMSAEGYETIDPEEDTLPERLEAKLQAIAEGRPAPVADVGQGVAIPAPIEAPADPALPPAPAPIQPPVPAIPVAPEAEDAGDPAER